MLKPLAFILVFVSGAVFADPQEVYWEDLVPEDYTMPQQQLSHDGTMMQMNLDAPVVEAFNGKQVKIPGFVVPLEGDEKLIKEFLLVPYFGACIHVPPPPPNQIVHVTFENGVAIENLYDAIWVEGTLSTKGWSGDIATVGYTLSGVKVLSFEG